MLCVWSQCHLESHHLHYNTNHQLQAHTMHAVLHNSFRSVTNQKAYSLLKSMLLVDKFHGQLTWPNKLAIGQFEFSHACWSKHVGQCAQCCHLLWWSAMPWFITNVHTPILEFITPKSNIFSLIWHSLQYIDASCKWDLFAVVPFMHAKYELLNRLLQRTMFLAQPFWFTCQMQTMTSYTAS